MFPHLGGNVTDKAHKVFVKSLVNRSESTMTPHVLHLPHALGRARWRVVDGWRASLALSYLVVNQVVPVVNHRIEWVTSEGVSNNIVEIQNNQLKIELNCRANRLGFEDR